MIISAGEEREGDRLFNRGDWRRGTKNRSIRGTGGREKKSCSFRNTKGKEKGRALFALPGKKGNIVVLIWGRARKGTRG